MQNAEFRKSCGLDLYGFARGNIIEKRQFKIVGKSILFENTADFFNIIKLQRQKWDNTRFLPLFFIFRS